MAIVGQVDEMVGDLFSSELDLCLEMHTAMIYRKGISGLDEWNRGYDWRRWIFSI